MKHKKHYKMPRHHPEVQNRDMLVEGFQDFAFLAFDPRYEKTAAPLSKRNNGVGPEKIGQGLFFGNAQPLGYGTEITMANRFAWSGVAVALGIVYVNTISNTLRKGADSSLDALRTISSLTAIRYVATGAVAYALITDFTQ